MTRGTRNDGQWQSAPEVEPDLLDLVGVARCEDGLSIESGTALEQLSLGHAGLRSECWPRSSGMESWSFRSELAALTFGQRVRRPSRNRTPRHRSRLEYKAEARFTPVNPEMLSD